MLGVHIVLGSFLLATACLLAYALNHVELSGDAELDNKDEE